MNETESFKRVSKIAAVTSLQIFHPAKADGERLVVDMTNDDPPMESAAMSSKLLSHRIVAQERNRDRRTEVYKAVSKMQKEKDAILIMGRALKTSRTTPFIIFATVVGGAISPPVFVAAAAGSLLGSMFLQKSYERINKNLKKTNIDQMTSKEREKFFDSETHEIKRFNRVFSD